MSINISFIRVCMRDPHVRAALLDAIESVNASLDEVSAVGHGGQGLVFRIKRIEYNDLLVKIPNYIDCMSSKIAEHNILKEALVHQNIEEMGDYSFIPKFVSASSEGKYYIREYVDAKTLQDCLKDMTYNNRIELLKKEIKFSHEVFSLFHDNSLDCFVLRDYKPKNILCTPDGRLILVDYGSVRRESEMRYKEDAKYRKIGTGKYLFEPLEQFCDVDGSLPDRSVDYFAHGVTMFYIAFQSYPYSNLIKDKKMAMIKYKKEYDGVWNRVRLQCQSDEEFSEFAEEMLSCLNVIPNKRFINQ